MTAYINRDIALVLGTLMLTVGLYAPLAAMWLPGGTCP